MSSPPVLSAPPATPAILVILVLYKVPAQQSQSFTTLQHYLHTSPLAAAFDLILADNTPYPQPRPAGYTGPYLADPGNPGLAAPYNTALAAAQARGIPWLLLLDQDTTLTPAFLDEAVATAAHTLPRQDIVALIPRLEDKGFIRSPHHPPVFGKGLPMDPSLAGATSANLYVFNSGAVLRVQAMTALGGFPRQFSLDFLDHATFAGLRRAGGKLFILNAVLHHELSDVNEVESTAANLVRQNSVLDAEYRFYKAYGTPRDRLIRRLRLLRSAAGRVAHGRQWAQTRRIIIAALRP